MFGMYREGEVLQDAGVYERASSLQHAERHSTTGDTSTSDSITASKMSDLKEYGRGRDFISSTKYRASPAITYHF